MNENISLKPKDFIKHADQYIWEDIFKNLKLSYEPYVGGELFEFQMATVTGFGRQI
jgi:hypothetical protein